MQAQTRQRQRQTQTQTQTRTRARAHTHSHTHTQKQLNRTVKLPPADAPVAGEGTEQLLFPPQHTHQ